MGHLDGRHEFPRFCIAGTMDMKACLLQKFSPVERNQDTIAISIDIELASSICYHNPH
ncbi:hypothetical protein SLEP1_g10721 [Rubroshorea leprosula]|uniref:Uncharacterized protein n=1 Tax=Rubroshorea leprosula TaxID=152421 RepID=A0AAV5IHH2_9ROSI|nr:hypothetical protein SLEP1_g10721 [Rubroshorea leprosula]